MVATVWLVPDRMRGSAAAPMPSAPNRCNASRRVARNGSIGRFSRTFVASPLPSSPRAIILIGRYLHLLAVLRAEMHVLQLRVRRPAKGARRPVPQRSHLGTAVDSA